MQLLPIETPVLTRESPFGETLCSAASLEESDIVAVSSKACAITEGGMMDLSALRISPEAERWAAQCGRSAAFRQAVLNETQRMHGTVAGSCPKAMLCELKPEGLERGSILAVNAGVDTSNVPEGFAVGWPKDPVATARLLRETLRKESGKNVAVLITDSCCRPRRLGVTAMALTVCGFEPLVTQIGTRDLFGNTLTMTYEAIADQLATAANFLMGNANQCVPGVVVRGHGLAMSDFCGWVAGIDPGEDLFQGLL